MCTCKTIGVAANARSRISLYYTHKQYAFMLTVSFDMRKEQQIINKKIFRIL